MTLHKLVVRNLAKVKPSATGHVYFFATHDRRFIKIGWSSDIHRRFKDIQASHPEPLAFLGAIEGARDVETAWHQSHRSLRVAGEWFTADEGLVWEINFAIISRPGPYYVTVEQAIANARGAKPTQFTPGLPPDFPTSKRGLRLLREHAGNPA